MKLLGPTRFWMDAPPAAEPLRFRSAPLLWAALAFASGEVLARQWHTPLHLAFAAALSLLLAVLALRRAIRVAAFAALALWVAAGCWCAQIEPPPDSQRTLLPYADGLSRTVRGHVVRVRSLPPAAAPAIAMGPSEKHEIYEAGGDPSDSVDDGPMSFDLQVGAVEDITPDLAVMRPLAGGVRVTIIDDHLPLACGDTLEVPLRMHAPETYRDPGAWSYADWLLGEGIGAQGSAKAASVRKTGVSSATWKCRFYAAQRWASGRVERLLASRANHALPAAARLNAEDAAMLRAMLFGDRTLLTRPLRAGFERTGTFHLFVVSGLHVALMAGGLYFLLRRFRLPEGWAVAGTIAGATLYALLTGFGVPVQRALGMTVVYLLARLFGRDRSPLNALGAAVLAVLALDPRALFESSFQMTSLVIVAVAGIAAPLERRLFATWSAATHELWSVRLDAALPPRAAALRVRLRMFGAPLAVLWGGWARDLPLWCLRALHWLLASVLAGAVVEVCMMLPMTVYFHRVTLLALPLNAVCIPLVCVLLCAGILTFCVSLVSTTAAALPAAITALLLHFVHGLVQHLGSIASADLRVPMPLPALLAGACLLLAFACWALRARARAWVIAGVAALTLIPVLLFWPSPPAVTRDALEVTALDVGQGDSLLVVAPDGGTLLVDAGGPVGRAPSAATSDAWDVGEEVVAPYLWSRGVRRLDAVLLTHAHSDHMGGMPAILRDFHPRELWISVEPGRAPALRALLSEARGLGIIVRTFHAGDEFPWSGLQARVLSPDAGYANAGAAANDDSLVMRVAYGKASVLLEGDAEARSEAAMVAHGLVGPATLLKVGHHGSRTSTNPAFLAAVAPQEAVVSVGRHNTFGHPRFEVLARLEAAGVRTFRTDRFGARTFLLRSDGTISDTTARSR